MTKFADEGTVGVEVSADGMSYVVTFNTTGAVGGHVTVKRGDEVFFEKDLATSVQPQTGYAEVK